MIAHFELKIEETERKNRLISAVVTALLVLLFLLVCMFWYAIRPMYVSIGETEIEMITDVGIGQGNGGGATLDYGDNRDGSGKVNNFLPATPNPNPNATEAGSTPAKAVTAEPKINVPSAPKADLPPPPKTSPNPSAKIDDKTPLSQKDDSPLTTPEKNDPKKDPKKDDKSTATTPPNPKSANSGSASNSSSPSNNQANSSANSNGGGGSNHGNTPGGVGNAGAPTVTQLNPEGIAWGDGSGSGGNGGLNNRKPVKITKPKYDIQEEGRVVYTLTIEPDGSVSYCKARPNNTPRLAALGEKTIKDEWRFDKLKPGSTTRQSVVVTIIFKIKN